MSDELTTPGQTPTPVQPDPTTPLTDRQINFAKKMCGDWIEIMRRRYPNGPSLADAYHSSLLERLLSGKKALPEPPPLRFSYPDYELAEGNTVTILEFWEYDPSTEWGKQSIAEVGSIVIDQGGGWDWFDRETGILKYRPTGHTYRYFTEERTRPRYHPSTKTFTQEPYTANILQRVMDKTANR